MKRGLVTRLNCQGALWEVVPGFEPHLPSVLAAPARAVKESRAKLVTEHRTAEGNYFVKRYRHDAFAFRPLKFFFKPSQAAIEWRLAEKVSSRGIPVVRHVAFGQRWSMTGLKESILITEGFDGVPANEADLGDGRALVAFIEQMARAGIVQKDLHPANLLVRAAPFEIRLVDLHGTKVLENATEAERAWNHDRMLALLRMTLPIAVSRAIELSSGQLRKQAFRERSARCLKTNRDFSRQRCGPWNWQVRTAALTPEMETLLAGPDEFIERGRSLKKGRSSTVAAARGLVLKRYNFKKPLNLLKDLFRGSRGRRGFRKAYHLELCGVATARVLATTDHLVLGLPLRSYLLMEEIAGAVDAGKFTGESRAAARALGRFIARLHEEGFAHRDLKETNLLLDPAGRPHLIDLDGLRFIGQVPPAEAANNLRRLADGLRPAGKLVRGNVLAFLLTYGRSRHLRPRQLFSRTEPDHARRPC